MDPMKYLTPAQQLDKIHYSNLRMQGRSRFATKCQVDAITRYDYVFKQLQRGLPVDGGLADV